MTTFGATYAGAYDVLYAGKDYEAECDVVERIIGAYGDGGAVRTVLDLGCGTGNHALPLARRGYDVTGVDRSDEMLARARAKAAEGGLAVRWVAGDVRDADAGAEFDVALLMFAVLGYQRTNDDVLSTLRNARRHLRAGGLLIFDAWHGPAVIGDPPRTEARVVRVAGSTLTRHVRSDLDVRRHLCSVHYTLSDGDGGGAAIGDETHVVRYFFPMELEQFLERAGFGLLLLGAFGEPEREPGCGDRSILVAARAA